MAVVMMVEERVASAAVTPGERGSRDDTLIVSDFACADDRIVRCVKVDAVGCGEGREECQRSSRLCV